MADKLFDDSEFLSRRFICDCMDAGHSLDISVEIPNVPRENYRDKRRPISVAFWARYYGQWMTFGQRIKAAIRILRKKDISEHDFVFRQEDIPELVELLGKMIDT